MVMSGLVFMEEIIEGWRRSVKVARCLSMAVLAAFSRPSAVVRSATLASRSRRDSLTTVAIMVNRRISRRISMDPKSIRVWFRWS